MQTQHFMAGMNVAGDDVREFPSAVVEILKPTPVKWLRIHELRNRYLDEKGPSGITYLEGIENLAKNGYNILATIEVGSTRNVGHVKLGDLDKFIEESYHEAFKSCKKISGVVRQHGRELMFGIENEIDPKAWILQALPRIEWRGGFETWLRQAVDFKLKYKRLNNILKGAKDADPDAKTMANIVAEDVRVFVSDFRGAIAKYSDFLKKFETSLDDIVEQATDWKIELNYLKDNLAVDFIGLDNYANWIIKYPIYGHETGEKVSEAMRITGKPAFNAEFGYTTYRTFFQNLIYKVLRRPSGSEMQLQFFKNSLGSIEGSSAAGTFPWVLITHPERPATPKQEAFFGLTKMYGNGQTVKEPAFDYYVEWLNKRMEKSKAV